jgi:RNA polymerase sigma factor FliA
MKPASRPPPAPLTPKQQKLVQGSMPLVDRLAKKVERRYRGWMEVDDLISLGSMGLIQAVQAYEDGRGVPFEAYAWPRIHGAMMNGAKKEVALAQGALRGAHKFAEAQRDEGDVFNDSEEQQRAQSRAFADQLLSAMLCGLVGEASQKSAARDEEAVTQEERYAQATEALHEALRRIEELGPTLIRLCYIEERTLKDAGEALGMSYATVRRFHNEVLKRLAALLRGMGVTAAPEMPT